MRTDKVIPPGFIDIFGAFALPQRALATHVLETSWQEVPGAPVEMRCGAGLMDSDVGNFNYYLIIGVGFKNVSQKRLRRRNSTSPYTILWVRF